MWHIYDLVPAPWGDSYRFVAAFDTQEDAKVVWDALEKVNVLMNCYKIVDMTKPYKFYKEQP